MIIGTWTYESEKETYNDICHYVCKICSIHAIWTIDTSFYFRQKLNYIKVPIYFVDYRISFDHQNISIFPSTIFVPQTRSYVIDVYGNIKGAMGVAGDHLLWGRRILIAPFIRPKCSTRNSVGSVLLSIKRVLIIRKMSSGILVNGVYEITLYSDQ